MWIFEKQSVLTNGINEYRSKVHVREFSNARFQADIKNLGGNRYRTWNGKVLQNK
jgi:hypothetical protein